MAELGAKEIEGPKFSLDEGICAVGNLEDASGSLKNKLQLIAEKKELIAEIKRKKTFSLMACGTSGAGKSTLLNGIAGKYVFKVAHTWDTSQLQVSKYSQEKDGHSFILYNTPGFDDELESANEQILYLKEITRECENVNTLFYCISLNHTRIIMRQDLSNLKMLKKALKPQIWESCVIVLTFANSIVDRIKEKGISKTDADIKQEYDRIIKEWEKKVVETFSRAEINPSTYNIPIVHAGVENMPLIVEKDLLPWLTVLWRAVHDRSPPDGKAVLSFFNFHRMRDRYETKNADLPLTEQPILVDMTFKEKLKDKYPVIAALSGIAGTAGGTIAIAAATTLTGGLGLIAGGLILGGVIGVGYVAKKVMKKQQLDK